MQVTAYGMIKAGSHVGELPSGERFTWAAMLQHGRTMTSEDEHSQPCVSYLRAYR